MSMKQLKVTPDIMAEEEAWVEEEIERELAALDLQQLEEENEEDTDAFVYKENLAEEDEVLQLLLICSTCIPKSYCMYPGSSPGPVQPVFWTGIFS